MADELVNEEVQSEPAEDAQEPQEGQQSEDQTESHGEDTPEGDEVPADVLRKQVSDANREAAKYRTQLREAQDALSKAKTVEEFEAAVSEFNGKITALEVENLKFQVATSTELPAKAIKFLTGSTKEELEASAAELKELFGQPAPKGSIKPPPNGGLNPSDEPKRFSPADIRKEMYPNRY
jgi:hypothetical protein